MGLTGSKMVACFQSYWYMWLTNGISGLLILGVQIGIMAFFMKKSFGKRPPVRPAAERVTSPERSTTPFEISMMYDPNQLLIPRPHSQRTMPPPSARAGVGEDNVRFEHSTLQAINYFRWQHSTGPLNLNPELSTIAQNLAEQMARASKLEHSPHELRQYGGCTLGEIYAASFQSELIGNKMVEKARAESKRYTFDVQGKPGTENFTQVVWGSSQEIGVGRARSQDGQWWYGVVVFYPPGNLPGQYANNVPFQPQ